MDNAFWYQSKYVLMEILEYLLYVMQTKIFH